MSDIGGLSPFLKWAGGKRWLFNSRFVGTLPAYKRYIEPFVGGGAGFFALQPSSAILSDVNEELIELYRVVRSQPGELQQCLARHQSSHCEAHFYAVRSKEPKEPVERAARTLYLNRTCWNGLYRLNRSGAFNVPIGTKSAVLMPSDNFEEASKLLLNASLQVSDFEPIIDQAEAGDLLFVDPPYTVRHNMNGFVKYNERIFSWADQVRLRAAIERAASRGASVVLTNADHASVRELYEEIGEQEVVRRASVISGKASGRSSTSELLVRL